MKIFDACLFGEKLVITDILEADVNGNLPSKKSAAAQEATDGPQGRDDKKVKQPQTSLLPYLSDRPKLVSFCDE